VSLLIAILFPFFKFICNSFLYKRTYALSHDLIYATRRTFSNNKARSEKPKETGKKFEEKVTLGQEFRRGT
jgi:hypothetical protein